MNQQTLENYARLLLEIGINLQEDEGVIIQASKEAIPLAEEITKKAYQMGAKGVVFFLSNDAMDLAYFEHGKEELFDHYPVYKAEYLKALYDDNYHHIFVRATDPELLKKVDQNRISRNQKSVMSAYRDLNLMEYRMNGITKWTIGTVASEAWAQSVFPNEENAVDKLEELILKASRLDQPDPVQAWKEHNKNLKQQEHYLNEQNFEKLHFKAPGTDLEVYLAEDHMWEGGTGLSTKGVAYEANIPTEEIFTAPHRDKVNGTVSSTKPLSLNGNLVTGMKFEFKDGKIVSFSAEQGQETFEKTMAQDEGASYLGEVALVPHDSPISNLNILFNNTIFDENASCHLAIGKGYGYTIKDGPSMSQEALREKGLNDSIVHVDFMIGHPEMKIVGTKHDGTEITVFEKGNWAK